MTNFYPKIFNFLSQIIKFFLIREALLFEVCFLFLITLFLQFWLFGIWIGFLLRNSFLFLGHIHFSGCFNHVFFNSIVQTFTFFCCFLVFFLLMYFGLIKRISWTVAALNLYSQSFFLILFHKVWIFINYCSLS